MNIFGTANVLSMPTFDSSALGQYYASGVSLGQDLLARKIDADIRAATDTLDASVIPPWDLPEVVGEDSNEILQRIFSTGALIDLDDPTIQDNGDDVAFKNLFAVYTGLSRMRELADFAATDALASSYSTLLQNKLDDYVAEIREFVGGLSFETATLLSGIRETSQTSILEFPKTATKVLPYHTGAVTSTVRDDPIAGLAGTETFDITVTDGGGDKVITIDLSAVSGALNEDNIATYINSQFSANSVLSSIKVMRHHEYAYGFEFDIASTETLSFGNASTSEPAIYVAGKNNIGEASSGFLKKLDGLSAASPTEVFRSEIDTTVDDDARAVAVDSNGFTYVVGATAGDMENQINQGASDAYLRKYDAAGNLVWSRLLGATDQSSGYAVAVDGSDNVIVAGTVNGQLTDTAYGGNTDSFVTKFNSSGVEQWTRQAAPYANDGALALTADSSGNVFIAGYTHGAIDTSTTHGGASDGYITKLDSDGTLVWNQQFGGASSDRATGIALDGSGNVFVAGENNGSAVVRKYTDAGASASLAWEADAGSISDGDSVGGIAIGSSGAVYLAGSTTNAALNGTIAQTHSGGMDGFVTKVTDNGATATVDRTSYLGTTGTDNVKGIAVRASVGADEIYVTGDTTGGIDGGTAASAQDYFAAKLNNAGTTDWAQQMRGSIAHTGNAVAFDLDGTSVISRLGLPNGTVPVTDPTEMIALTNVRAGQSFKLSVDGETPRTVTIESDDTLGFLAYKIKQILGTAGQVTLEDDIDAKTMTIEAIHGGRVEIIAGPEGFDALPALGLKPGLLFGEPADEQEDEDTIYELGLVGSPSVADKTDASDTVILIDNAIREIKDMFRYISLGPEDEQLRGLQPISEADSEKIAALQATLTYVTSLADSAKATNDARLNNLVGSPNQPFSAGLFNLII